MTSQDKIARRKIGLLDLAKELHNVSRACRTLGYSRQQFYEIRRNFQTFGTEGLIDRLPGAKGPHPNRVAQEIEDRILKEALDHPTHGALRVAQNLALEGFIVSSGGVRGVWQRHNLSSRHDRLLRLENKSGRRHLSSVQIKLKPWNAFRRNLGNATLKAITPAIWWLWIPSLSAI